MPAAAAPFATTGDLVRDLRALGVAAGQVLMVHSSLSSLGRVLGGAPAVVRALLAALGPNGTLVMPAFSPEVSDPARWADRSFADADLERARAHMPAFDLDTTPPHHGRHSRDLPALARDAARPAPASLGLRARAPGRRGRRTAPARPGPVRGFPF